MEPSQIAMRKIIYYVAISLDGYIGGPGDDISMFTANGKGVERYLTELKDFDTVIMGRNMDLSPVNPPIPI